MEQDKRKKLIDEKPSYAIAQLIIHSIYILLILGMMAYSVFLSNNHFDYIDGMTSIATLIIIIALNCVSLIFLIENVHEKKIEIKKNTRVLLTIDGTIYAGLSLFLILYMFLYEIINQDIVTYVMIFSLFFYFLLIFCNMFLKKSKPNPEEKKTEDFYANINKK